MKKKDFDEIADQHLKDLQQERVDTKERLLDVRLEIVKREGK